MLFLAIWRICRFLNDTQYVKIGRFGLPCFVFWLIATLVQCRNKEKCEPIIKKLIELNEFEKKHPDFSWKVGADWPEGFDGE